MRQWLVGNVQIQQSWLEAGEPLIRYEDVLENDVEILERVLIDQCGLPVDRKAFRKIVLNNRFERLSRGRARGQEEVTSHVRKGIAGDWQNYFTDTLKREFKELYGDLLIATGYEQDHNW
jgi:lipopolysaccharide transport system ATP-binding protein